jgi:16S rRNA (cytosine967-C5)-methyltransferase
MNARVIAAKTLAAVTSGTSLVSALPRALEGIHESEKALLNQLVHGTLREWPRLAAILAQRLERPLKPKDADIFALLMLGVYQLDCMCIPAHAVVSETVEGVRGLRKDWARGLVNAVLRGFIRDGAPPLSDAEAAALPSWWWGKLGKQWPEQRVQIAEAARVQPPLTLRVNTAIMCRESYAEQLTQQGIEFSLPVYAPQAITLHGAGSVTDLPGFLEGVVSVQDASAQIAAQLLANPAHQHVLDACAAPGGKTCHLAELMPNAQIVASDSNAQRLKRVTENVNRLKLTNVSLACLDASQASQSLNGKLFDAILADVPCSASGVTRRNPDIKVLRQPEDLQRFADQQKAIVAGLWPLLKPGGELLYVTCSIFSEENDQVIEQSVSHLTGASVESRGFVSGVATRTGYQRLPDARGDGLFFALLRRSRV